MDQNQQLKGSIAAASAFSLWGLMVVFWKHLSEFYSLELIGHRLIWSPLILLLVVFFRGKRDVLFQSFKNPHLVRVHFFNGLLLLVNWSFYLYAVTHDQILQGSLAYFIVPILNTCMGFLVLKQSLSKLQWAAIALATLGVVNEMWQFGKIPWLALVIALSFALYGMNKTKSSLGPINSLAMETVFLIPFAFIILMYFNLSLEASVGFMNPSHLFWMIMTGLVTIVPLLMFAYGVKRIQLATVGIFQFIAPTIKFFLGVYVYGESFTSSKLLTFALIWIAIMLYLMHLFRSVRRQFA